MPGSKTLAPAAYYPHIPDHFPNMKYPVGNEWTEERWLLGKKMFYDPVFSDDGLVSCASCHKPHLAFSDDRAFSVGSEGQFGRNNAPSLTNIGYHPYFTRAGGVPTLEMQVLVPIQEHDEFNTNILLIANKLNEDPEYVEMSRAAYGRPVDSYVITRALANFERSLVSGDSPYDRYLAGDYDALSTSEKRGLELFNSDRLACSKCHSGFNFTNYAFENNGLYASYKSEGRKRLTGLDADKALFKVPTLRNIGVTAPYMHDGSLETLDDVLDHYNSGGYSHPNKSSMIRSLDMSEPELKDVRNFLLSLTDDSFINNPYFH
ncbi:MAG: cytochrome c peroxidase [Saprospiraceae bacterium]|nr:cytochrome c peroxidase [Saprospiraceae bacterium]